MKNVFLKSPRFQILVVLASFAASIVLIRRPGSRVPSMGSPFPSFSNTLSDPSFWIFAAVQFLFYGSLAYRHFFTVIPTNGPGSIRNQNIVLSIFGGLYTFWVGYGITARASNTRIHWVDCPNGACGDDLRYWVIKVLNSNEYLNLNPNVLQGIFFGIISFLFVTIIADYTKALVWRLAGLGSIILGAPLAMFLQPGEDTALGVLVIAIAAYLVRYNGLVWISLAGFIPTLVRPQFAVFIVAAGVTAFFGGGGESVKSFVGRIRAAAKTTLMSLLLFCFYQFFVLESFGNRWFLKGGEGLFDTSATDNVSPIEVEGFTISFFSGSFLGHLLWIAPFLFLIPWLCLRIFGKIDCYESDGPRKSVIIFMMSGGVLTLLVLEAFPVLYFNLRYLTFAGVPLIISAITLLGIICEKSSWRKGLEGAPGKCLVAAVLVGGSLASVTPIHGLSPSSRMSFDASAVGELWDSREVLRSLSKDRDVVVLSKSKSDFNMASYFAGRRLGKVSEASEVAANTLVFCPRPCEVGGRELVASSSYSVVLSD